MKYSILVFSAAILAQTSSITAYAQQTTKNVDPAGTWLATASRDSPHPPTSLNLKKLGISAGQVLLLTSKGSYYYRGAGSPTATGMLAVFKGKDGILPPDPSIAVTPVITVPSYYGSIPTDIPEDFDVSPEGTYVQVPPGATSLMFGPNDSLFRDNVSIGYKVKVKQCPSVDAC